MKKERCNFTIYFDKDNSLEMVLKVPKKVEWESIAYAFKGLIFYKEDINKLPNGEFTLTLNESNFKYIKTWEKEDIDQLLEIIKNIYTIKEDK